MNSSPSWCARIRKQANKQTSKQTNKQTSKQANKQTNNKQTNNLRGNTNHKLNVHFVGVVKEHENNDRVYRSTCNQINHRFSRKQKRTFITSTLNISTHSGKVKTILQRMS